MIRLITREFRASIVLFSAPRNPYSVLGVTRKADQAEIKQAYFDLAKKYHPDVSNDSKA
jgi:molecular chaperone DnaJ